MTARHLAKNLAFMLAHVLGLPRICRRRLSSGFIILTYHSFQQGKDPACFVSQPQRDLERQLDYLQAHFNVRPLADLLIAESGSRMAENGRRRPDVAITVDDGYRDNYEILFPLVKGRKIPVTIFLATGCLDRQQPPWTIQLRELLRQTPLHELKSPLALPLRTPREREHARSRLKEFLSPLPPGEREELLNRLRVELRAGDGTRYTMLTWDQVREMKQYGVSFGSHTAQHSLLSRVTPDVAERELRESRSRMTEELGEAPELFCYPDGSCSDSVARLVRESGYRAAVTQQPGLNQADADCFRLKRVQIPHNESLDVFACRVSLVPQVISCSRGGTPYS
jgi:peptidoglycan/xylan/chitin deacetylase (PgdA/CDA1 family)